MADLPASLNRARAAAFARPRAVASVATDEPAYTPGPYRRGYRPGAELPPQRPPPMSPAQQDARRAVERMQPAQREFTGVSPLQDAGNQVFEMTGLPAMRRAGQDAALGDWRGAAVEGGIGALTLSGLAAGRPATQAARPPRGIFGGRRAAPTSAPTQTFAPLTAPHTSLPAGGAENFRPSQMFAAPQSMPRLPGRASDGSILPMRTPQPFRRTAATSGDLREAAQRPDAGGGGAGQTRAPRHNAAYLEDLRAQGFDVDVPLYHGTGRDFDGFQNGREGATFLTTDPDLATVYADRDGGFANVRPVFIKPGRVLTFHDTEVPQPFTNTERLAQARSEGYDAVRTIIDTRGSQDRVIAMVRERYPNESVEALRARLGPANEGIRTEWAILNPQNIAPRFGAPRAPDGGAAGAGEVAASGAREMGNLGKPWRPRRDTESPVRFYFGEDPSMSYSEGPLWKEIDRRIRGRDWQMEDVRLEDLTAGGQDIVEPGFRRVPWPDGYGNGPVTVIRHRGRMYIEDGNHRLVAAAERGEPSVRAAVIDADSIERPSPQAPSVGAGANSAIPFSMRTATNSSGGRRHTLSLGEGLGSVRVAEDGDAWRIIDSNVAPSLRGQGQGVRLYEELIRRARENGVSTIRSDAQVSLDAQRVYQSLRRRGYSVEERPGAPSPDYPNNTNYTIRITPQSPARGPRQ